MSTRQIGPDTFEVQPLPALRSFLLQPRIAPAIAEALGAIGVVQGGDVGSLDTQALGGAVARFFARMPPAELEAVMRELLSTCRVSNGQGGTMELMPVFDVKMRGRTMETWKLIAFAIEVNYPDFFGLLGALRADMAKASTSAQ